MAPEKPIDPQTSVASPDAARRVQSVRGTKGDPAREARIKAALKANIARRKAQVRARNEDETDHD